VSADRWSGTLHLARDFALLRGHAGATDTHAHYAHQLLISLDAPVTVRIDGTSQHAHRVLIESMRRHAIVDAPAEVFTVYIEPLTVEAAALEALAFAQPTVAALVQALTVLPRRQLADPRIAEALAQVDALLDGKVRAADVAAHVALSLSQLERLFAAHVGLPVRRLVRWRRLRLALALAVGGQSLTEAAHSAGFADSAHFSRVMRDMFGVRADRTLPGLLAQPIG
jgi:AraC-like DNA-binding protein